jgi:hypothetical protein
VLRRAQEDFVKDIIADAVRFYYEEGNDEIYVQRCREALDVADVVGTTAAEFAEDVYVPNEDAFWPAHEVWPLFGTFTRGVFEAEFQSQVYISKLARLFHVSHAFSVKNCHEQRVAPTLDGYGNTGYVMRQFDMHETLRQRLTERDYAELDLADMDEIVPGLSFPGGVTIFGRQVSVRYALFHDLRGLCSQD